VVILVDASVIFDHTRNKDPRLAGWFLALPVAVCGVTRAEVLAGARNPADRVNLVGLLTQFAQVPTPDSIWDEVGDNLNALRSGGVTVPFPDAVLATLAIANDIELWTRDSHFTLMQRVLSRLKLFAEPP
jgi:predicted nucleic acid-binding protein